jgi:hypothetical protein
MRDPQNWLAAAAWAAIGLGALISAVWELRRDLGGPRAAGPRGGRRPPNRLPGVCREEVPADMAELEAHYLSEHPYLLPEAEHERTEQ